LLLGYLDAKNYADGRIPLNPRRSRQAVQEHLCENLGLDVIESAKLIKRQVDINMANGISTELRTRGYEPKDFTILAYGGNGPLHACGIANALGISKILAPPFSSTFSACGAGSVSQMHIHEMSTWAILFNSNTKQFFSDFDNFNNNVETLERRGKDDLLRQGMDPAAIKFRLELDMRYGNQRVQTAVISDLSRLKTLKDVLSLMDQFHKRYGERFGEGSQSPETGVRINTIRVCSYVEQPAVQFTNLQPNEVPLSAPEPISHRECHFVGHPGPINTPVYGEDAKKAGVMIHGPAIITTRATTYLVEPEWVYHAVAQGAVWFMRAH
jgi:N-methylhydantoinase A